MIELHIRGMTLLLASWPPPSWRLDISLMFSATTFSVLCYAHNSAHSLLTNRDTELLGIRLFLWNFWNEWQSKSNDKKIDSPTHCLFELSFKNLQSCMRGNTKNMETEDMKRTWKKCRGWWPEDWNYDHTIIASLTLFAINY